MSTNETNKARELANQIRAQLQDVSLKAAELSNLGFKVQILGDTTETLELIATRVEEIKL